MKYERKIVKSYIDADRLMKMGFRCLGMDKNIHDNTKLIFWFENTKEVNDALSEISRSFKNN